MKNVRSGGIWIASRRTTWDEWLCDAKTGPGIIDEIIPDRLNREIVILLTAGKGLEDLFFDRDGSV
jgi:hypothetical protein